MPTMGFYDWVNKAHNKSPELEELASVMSNNATAWRSVADLKQALQVIADDKSVKAQDKTRLQLNLVDFWANFESETSAADMRVATPRRRIWRTFLTENPAIAATSAFSLILLFVIIWAIWDDSFLKSLGDPNIARGLITFFFALGTVGVAIILTTAAFSISAQKVEVMKERFDMGKQILTALIGIFGTILGFYFGSLNSERNPNPNPNDNPGLETPANQNAGAAVQPPAGGG
jgi:hypothetical protein